MKCVSICRERRPSITLASLRRVSNTLQGTGVGMFVWDDRGKNVNSKVNNEKNYNFCLSVSKNVIYLVAICWFYHFKFIKSGYRMNEFDCQLITKANKNYVAYDVFDVFLPLLTFMCAARCIK